MSLSKPKLISAVAANLDGVRVNTVEKVVDETLRTIREELDAGGSVDLFGFGKFSIVEKEARVGRNPATGAALTIPAKRVVKFGPAKALKDFLNQ